jgi:hypothetical protein
MGVKLGPGVLIVFEDRVLRDLIGPKHEKAAVVWRKAHKTTFIICILRQILVSQNKRE